MKWIEIVVATIKLIKLFKKILDEQDDEKVQELELKAHRVVSQAADAQSEKQKRELLADIRRMNI